MSRALAGNGADAPTGEMLRTAVLLLGFAALVGLSAGYTGGFHSLQDLANRSADPLVWSLFTQLGETPVLLSFALLFARRRPDILWALLCGALLAAATARGLKFLVDAPRPSALLLPGEFLQAGPVLRRNSFPSGHTLLAFLFAGVVFHHLRGWFLRGGLLLLAALVGFSRIAVGAHWPVDVLTGAALGLMVAVAAVLVARRFEMVLVHATARRLMPVVPLLACVATLLMPHPMMPVSVAGSILAAIVLGWYLLEPRWQGGLPVTSR
ncbi:MAG: hypothetical protein RL026_2339 [Pseudomonadota bacterium]|jgi:membrane-associated phospholipid phosphatase